MFLELQVVGFHPLNRPAPEATKEHAFNCDQLPQCYEGRMCWRHCGPPPPHATQWKEGSGRCWGPQWHQHILPSKHGASCVSWGHTSTCFQLPHVLLMFIRSPTLHLHFLKFHFDYMTDYHCHRHLQNSGLMKLQASEERNHGSSVSVKTKAL